MPHKGKPRRGSLRFRRTRAKRIYPSVSFFHDEGVAGSKPLAFAGWKAGMTQVKYSNPESKSPTHGKSIAKAVTIIETPSLLVCGIKFYSGGKSVTEKWMENLPKNIQKKTGKQNGKIPDSAEKARLIVATQPEKSGMKKKKPDVFEIGVGGKDNLEYAKSLLGKEIDVNDVFSQGEKVIITAVTKGHGVTGPVKRYGIRLQGRKDKQMHRHPGSLGSQTPGKMDWRVPMAGQYGFFNRTERNRRIILIGDDASKVNHKGGIVRYGLVKGKYVLIEGSVPGTKKRLVIMRRSALKQVPVETSYVSVESKQGV